MQIRQGFSVRIALGFSKPNYSLIFPRGRFAARNGEVTGSIRLSDNVRPNEIVARAFTQIAQRFFACLRRVFVIATALR